MAGVERRLGLAVERRSAVGDFSQQQHILGLGMLAEVVVGMRTQQQQVKLRFRTLAEQDRILDMNHGRIGDRTRQQTGENAYGSRMKTANRRHLE